MRHCILPNGSHLRACDLLFKRSEDLPASNFIGLMVFDEVQLCPGCVNRIETSLRDWRKRTGTKYKSP